MTHTITYVDLAQSIAIWEVKAKIENVKRKDTKKAMAFFEAFARIQKWCERDIVSESNFFLILEILHEKPTLCVVEVNNIEKRRKQYHRWKYGPIPASFWALFKIATFELSQNAILSCRITLRSLINVQCTLINFLKKSSLYALIKDL